MANHPDELLFSEVQRFTQPWIWIVVAGIAGLQWWGFIQQFVFGRPFGDNPEPVWMSILFCLLFGIGLPWMMLSCRLTIAVDPGGVIFQYRPFHFRLQRIPLEAIQAYAAVRYSPLLDYGGWGIRYGHGGKAYNVKGNQGVRFELGGGRHLLLGSQRALEFETAIRSAMAERAR